MYSFVYNLPNDGLVEAETYSRDIITTSDYLSLMEQLVGLNTIYTVYPIEHGLH